MMNMSDGGMPVEDRLSVGWKPKGVDVSTFLNTPTPDGMCRHCGRAIPVSGRLNNYCDDCYTTLNAAREKMSRCTEPMFTDFYGYVDNLRHRINHRVMQLRHF